MGQIPEENVRTNARNAANRTQGGRRCGVLSTCSSILIKELPDVQEVVRQGEGQEISTKNIVSLITEYRTEVNNKNNHIPPISLCDVKFSPFL